MAAKRTGLIVFLFLLAYFPLLQWMWQRWFAYDSYYSHGILIPLTSIFLIWQQRPQLRSMPAHPSPWGPPVFLTGILLHIASLLLGVYFTSGFSMILVLMGLVLCVWGEDALRAVFFPLAFLVFMVPLPLVVVINMSFGLKLLSAKMAGTFLNFMNIPTVQEGSFIRMPHATVVVEDVCSGLKSLIALLALGALFSHWMKSGRFQKVMLFVSSIPIALVTNTLRIIILAMISECWGTRYVTGFVHDCCGMLIFVLAFLFLHQMEKLLKGIHVHRP